MAAALDAEDSRVSTAQPVEEESSSSSSEEEYVDSDALSEDETVITVDSQGVEKKKRRRRATKGSSEKRRKRAEKRRLADLRKAEAAENIKTAEREERFSMRYEDFRSREVRKDEHRLQVYLEGADRALDKADYILEQRDEEEGQGQPGA